MRHLAKRRSTFGVLLTRRHGWPKKFSGEMAPSTGPRVSVSRYRDQLKSYTSPGLVFAPLGAMPPPSTKRHCTRLFLVCHVPSSGPFTPLALPASSRATPSHVGTGSLSATADTLARNASIPARAAAVFSSVD